MPDARPSTFKIVQLNAENLFLFFDQPIAASFDAMNEADWQKLSVATVANKSLVKTRWLAQSLLEIDADLVCVNEVGGLESLTNFSRYFLNDAYEPLLIEGNSNRGIDVGYLLRRSLDVRAELRTHKQRPIDFLYPHEIQSNEYFATTAPEKVIRSHYFSRDCAELRLYRPGEARPSLIALLVHLKSKLDPDHIDPQGRQRRTAEAKVLMDIYRETRAEFTPPVPTLVAGDFNGFARSTARAEEFLAINGVDLKSVTELAGHEGEHAATQIVFSRSGGGVQFMEIDFIFVSPELAQRLIASEIFRYRGDARVPMALPRTYEQRLYLPSDHYPVVATFQNPFAAK